MIKIRENRKAVHLMIGDRSALYMLLFCVALAALAMGLLAYNSPAQITNNEEKTVSTTHQDLSGPWHGRYSSGLGSGEWVSNLTRINETMYVGDIMANGPYSTNGEKIPIKVNIMGETLIIRVPQNTIIIEGRLVGEELRGVWWLINGTDQGEWRGVRGTVFLVNDKT